MAKRKTGKGAGASKRPLMSIPLDRVLIYAVAFLLFAVPLFLWPGLSEYGYGKTMVVLIGVSVLAVLWGLSAWQSGRWSIRIPWIVLPLFGVVAAALLSLLHATNGSVVVQSTILLVFFIVFLLILANAVCDRRDVFLLLFVVLLSASLTALYGLLQYLGVMRGPMGWGGLNNVISTMGNRNYLGGFLAYLLLPAVVLVIAPRSRLLRVTSILLIAFCFGTVLLLRQTGTAVALVLSLVAVATGMAIFRPFEPIRRNRRWIVALAATLLLTFLIEAPSGPLNSVVGLSADEPTSVGLLLDPGFEQSSIHWGPYGDRQPSGGIDDSAWWRIDRDGNNRGAWQLDAEGSQRMIPIRPGQSFKLGGGLLSDGRTTAQLRILLLDINQERIRWIVGGQTTATVWKEVETPFTAPEDARYVSVYLLATGADGWAGFDELYLEPIGALEAWARKLWDRNSGGVRTWDWWIGLEMFADHPLVGIGLGNYKIDFLQYKAEFRDTPRGKRYEFHIARAAQAHNEYVQLLAELGVFGAVAVLAVLAALAITAWKRLQGNDPSSRLELLLLGGGIVTMLAHAAVSFPLHLPTSSLVVILFGGIAFSRAYGDAGVGHLVLAGWRPKATLAATAAIGIAVSVFAVRDLQANLLMSKGIEQTQLGNLARAEALFERSLELDFAPRQTYYHLATVQIERGDLEAAEANLERSLTRFREESVYLNYANLLANGRQFDRALETIEFLLSTQPREEIRIRARYLEAVIVAQTGDPQRATTLLVELAEDAPTFEAAHIGLGTVYEARGMTVNARQAYETALTTIEAKLETAQAALASQQTITAQEYGKLRTEIEQLRQARETVRDKLEGLPPR